MKEGYGINNRIVEEFHSQGVKLILTVDNGISATEPVQRARQLGIKVIITDHHDIPPQLPPAHAILNPKLISTASPYRGLAGVGIAYILAVTLAQQLGKEDEIYKTSLELFTLGTIADLAPLTGVNRRWLKRGLRYLPQSQLTGVQALIGVSGVNQQQKALKPEDIGFRLGPRINAVGRLADPQIAIELLTTTDKEIAWLRAMQCEQLNRQRQEMCSQIEEEAIALCADKQINFQKERVLVIVQPQWHHGVIGIVASRLVERYGIPVFLGTYENDSHLRGSARGIPEFNVFHALQYCDNLLEKYDGHVAAGGFSLLECPCAIPRRYD
jgi:single-stranded-DNA-specific exonuclease